MSLESQQECSGVEDAVSVGCVCLPSAVWLLRLQDVFEAFGEEPLGAIGSWLAHHGHPRGVVDGTGHEANIAIVGYQLADESRGLGGQAGGIRRKHDVDYDYLFCCI